MMINPFTLDHLNTAIISEYQDDTAIINSCVSQEQNVFVYFDTNDTIEILLKNLKAVAVTHNAIYLDLKNIFSAKLLLSYMTKELLRAFSSNLKDIFEFSNKYMPNLKPQFQKQGQLRPELAINYSINEDTIYTFIKELFDAIDNMATDFGKPILIIINHFDNIHFIDKRKVEELIRDKISRAKKINYVMACSNEKAIAKMFDKKSAPLYRIKKMHALKTIPDNFKLKYIFDTFNNCGYDNLDQMAELITKRTSSLHNVFHICNKIYSHTIMKHHISPQVIKEAVKEILSELGPCYSNIWDDLSPHQKTLLLSIASKGGSQIFASKYLFENDLGSAPSVQTSISALLKKNILLKKEKDFYFCDHFFKEWILTIFA